MARLQPTVHPHGRLKGPFFPSAGGLVASSPSSFGTHLRSDGACLAPHSRQAAMPRAKIVHRSRSSVRTVPPANWSLLKGLPPAEVDAALAAARPRTYKRGATVFHQGDDGDSVHVS